MNKVRTLTLCLIAAFAITAIAAATASAEKLPAWGKCEVAENHEGHYGDAGCTEKVGKVFGKYNGGYEWFPLQTLGAGEEATELEYTGDESPLQQPVSQTTLTLASGQSITCGAVARESYILLSGPHVTIQAPRLHFLNCVDDQGGAECHTTDAGNGGEITTKTAWRAGIEHEPGSWTGTMSFISGKRTSAPEVGLVYETEQSRGRFLQELVCEGETEPLTIVIGGYKPHEQITLPISPVNEMSSSFTAELRQSGSVQLPASLEGHATRALEATVNGGTPETIGIETTMLFPEMYVSFENRRAEEVEKTLELKATP